MSEDRSWTANIKKIGDTDEVSAAVINVPIQQLASRTEYLKVVIENATSNEFNYLNNVAIVGQMEVGQAVYWDAEARAFAPTLAKWQESLTEAGSLQIAESTVFIGILVNKFTKFTGSVISGGRIKDFENIDVLFGESNPEAGMYYLSDVSPGQVTKTSPPMSALALIYDGDSSIMIPSINADRSTHDHITISLTDQWIDATDTLWETWEIEIPTGAIYGYRIDTMTDSQKRAFSLYIGKATFVDKSTGTIKYDYFLNQDTFWTTSVPVDDVEVHIAVPHSHGPNVIRAIQSDSLSLKEDNGLVTIDLTDLDIVSAEEEDITIVKAISSKQAQVGTTVNKIIAGDGIEVDKSQGNVSVSLTEFNTRYIDPAIINLNRAVQLTDNKKIYVAFPAAIESSISGVINLPNWGSSQKSMDFFVWLKGPEGGQNAPIPAMEVEITKFGVPTDIVGNSLSEGGSISLDIPIQTEGTLPSNYYMMKVSLNDTELIEANAQLQYELKFKTIPTRDYLIMRQGVVVYT